MNPYHDPKTGEFTHAPGGRAGKAFARLQGDIKAGNYTAVSLTGVTSRFGLTRKEGMSVLTAVSKASPGIPIRVEAPKRQPAAPSQRVSTIATTLRRAMSNNSTVDFASRVHQMPSVSQLRGGWGLSSKDAKAVLGLLSGK